MSRITNAMVTRNVLADVERASARLAKTTAQLSSGKALNRPSDDPVLVGRSLQLRNEMSAVRQYQTNVSDAQGWTDVTDSALTTVAGIVQRARELVVQAASDTMSGDQRKAIGEEVKGLIDSVKGAGNASYGGRYIFAGTATDAPPYRIDSADDTFHGNDERVGVQVGAGVVATTNVDGRTAFGDGPDGLVGTLRSVLGHLTSDDGPALTADIGRIDTALDQLNAVRSTVGATSGRLEVAASRLAEHEGTTLQLLSKTEDVDFGRAMIDYSTQQAALQASLQAGARIVQHSLLDFLR